MKARSIRMAARTAGAVLGVLLWAQAHAVMVVPVAGYIKESRIFFSGVAEGDGAGTLNLKMSTGATCLGVWRYDSPTSGVAQAQCTDGRTVRGLFHAVDPISGTSIGSGDTSLSESVVMYGGRFALEYLARQPQTPREELLAVGTGIAVAEGGFLITNHHVVEDCKRVTASIDGTELSAVRVAADPAVDLAALKARSWPGALARWRLDAGVGDPVYALGYPLYGDVNESLVFQQGMVTSLAGMKGSTVELQHSAALNPGNSGGPLLDASGLVAGVNVAVLRAQKDVASQQYYAIKAATARQFLDSHRIPMAIASPGPVLPAGSVFKKAARFTALISCYGSR